MRQAEDAGLDWRLKSSEEVLANAKKELMSSSKDVNKVRLSLKKMGVDISEGDVQRIKLYLFGEDTVIGMYRENYVSWLRLTRGEGKITDARFLFHEHFEINRMQELGKDMDFDPTGMSLGKLGNRDAFKTYSDPLYKKAHQEALQVEYRQMRDKIEEVSGVKLSLSEVAVADCDRLGTVIRREYKSISTSDFEYNRHYIDGNTINQHELFPKWEQKVQTKISISESVRKNLGLESKEVEIYRLASAVKAYSPH